MTHMTVERHLILNACEAFPGSYSDYMSKYNPSYINVPDDHADCFERRLDRVRTLKSMCKFAISNNIATINLSLEDFDLLEVYFA